MATLPDISEHLHVKQGFCHPDWAAISRVIEKRLPESEWNSAWEAASRSWVDCIRVQLGGDYHVYETPNFMILSEAPMRVIMDACRSYEDSLKRILANLEGIASDAGYGKHVVLMFASLDDYYGYITYFYPEGESPMSGGVCLSGEGYIHFAFPTVDYSSYRTVLVHELTHGCLENLPIPSWLNEALAMRMEQVICGSATFRLDREVYDKHTAHWNDETIQQFWTGESWEIPGNSFELSYNLAQVLWRKIEADLAAPRTEILQFIMDAHYKDAGESACQANFGLSLGDLVMDFLGDGVWAPDPTRWPNKSPLPTGISSIVSLQPLRLRAGGRAWRSSKRMKTIHRILCLMIASLLAILISSCCNRPYAAGSQTWPQENKYPQGPYDLMVRCCRIQTGFCPKADDKGTKVTIIIWNFNHQNKLFHDTFKSDLYFEDVYARFQKDGSVVVVDDKSNRTVRKYSRISDKQWRYQP